jgi:putative salt-induced outer membrane protein YdiY
MQIRVGFRPGHANKKAVHDEVLSIQAGDRPNFGRRPALLLVLLALSPFAALQADTIELSNGDRISGTLIETNEEGTVIENPVFGRVLIPHGHIVAVVPTAGEDVEAVAKARTAEEAASAAQAAGADTSVKAQIIPPPEPVHIPEGLFGTDFLRGWEKSFQLGLSGSSGNSEKTNLRVGVQASHEDERDRWNFNSVYYFAKDDGSTTDNEFFAALVKDWLIPESRWFYFVTGRFDWDDFQSWKYRVSGHGGIGYHLVQTEDVQLDGRLGGGFSQEFDRDEFRPEALAGIEGSWQITETQKISGGATIFPDLSDSSQFRTLSHLDWTIALDDSQALNLALGVSHEYQSDVEPGDDRNDTKYYVTLVYKF